MIHPDPRLRPSAATLVQHPVLCPNAKKTMAQLRHELNEERFKNGVLSRWVTSISYSVVHIHKGSWKHSLYNQAHKILHFASPWKCLNLIWANAIFEIEVIMKKKLYLPQKWMKIDMLSVTHSFTYIVPIH